jgi:hypothetical protein
MHAGGGRIEGGTGLGASLVGDSTLTTALAFALPLALALLLPLAVLAVLNWLSSSSRVSAKESET